MICAASWDGKSPKIRQGGGDRQFQEPQQAVVLHLVTVKNEWRTEKAAADGTTLRQAAVASGKTSGDEFDKIVIPGTMVGSGSAGA